MSTLAPAVSQTLAARDRLDAALQVNCSASGTRTAPGAPRPAHPALHLDACAYCGLAAHLLALPPAAPPPAPAAPLAQALPIGQQTEAPALARDRTAQPRAPPALS